MKIDPEAIPLTTGELIGRINATVIGQAFKFAYAICDNKVEFVDRYWPRHRPQSYAHLVEPPGGFPKSAEGSPA
jgi:hypothetical protein